jgi:NAD(P)H-dependent FMN reductase
MKIIGLSGSLRKGSFNAALLRAAVAAAPAELTIEVGSIRGIPLYDGDLEAESGPPEAVRDLQNRIAEADGLLLVTPEYNHSVPGVFKNAIDWLSRPPSEIPRVFGDLPVALMGATPGPAGTILAQTAWLPVLRTLRTRPWFGGRILVSGAARVFDASGQLLDEKLHSQLQTFLAGFARFASQPRAR